MPKEITPLNPLNGLASPRQRDPITTTPFHAPSPSSSLSPDPNTPLSTQATKAQISTQGSLEGKVYNELGQMGGQSEHKCDVRDVCASVSSLLSDWKFKQAGPSAVILTSYEYYCKRNYFQKHNRIGKKTNFNTFLQTNKSGIIIDIL